MPWSYMFPVVVDADGDMVTVEVVNTGGATFVQVFNDRLEIADLSAASVLVGSYQMTIDTFDGFDRTSYLLTLSITINCSTMPAISVPNMVAHVNYLTDSFSFPV